MYGLGANALSAEAGAKIFEAKQRPNWDPLIVHVCDREMLGQVVQGKLSRMAEALTEKFWPGPLTLLLPRTKAVPDAVTAGRPLVGVRMPAHTVALELIRLAGVPLAAPSANRFGHTSPTTAAHVLADLDGRIDAVLDGGPTKVGLESTVAEVTDEGIIVYRPGGVTIEMLETVIGEDRVRFYAPPGEATEPQSLPSPGVGIRHYAPRAEVSLCQIRKANPEASEDFARWLGLLEQRGAKLGVMLPDGWNAGNAQLVYHWGPWEDQDQLAGRLYAGLRELDDRGATIIAAPLPEVGGMGFAIQDRLKKAAK